MRSSSSVFAFISIAIILAVALAGCTKKQTHATTPPVATAPPPTRATVTPAAATDVQASPHVGVSSELAAACKLHFGAPVQAPKFDFDAAALGPDDRDVLTAVATCLTSGPLAGHRVTLVGRADPRGTDEYNLALGQRRAAAVSEYLGRLGVTPTQLADTTRGALDAKGRDESSWRDDRRVDLQLAD